MREPNIVSRVGLGIQRRREKLEMSQRHLTALINKSGVSIRQSTLSKIEQGRLDPRFSVLYAVSAALDISIDDLVALGYGEDGRGA